MGDLGPIIVRLVVLKRLHGLVSCRRTDCLVGEVRLVLDGSIGMDSEELVSLTGERVILVVGREFGFEVFKVKGRVGAVTRWDDGQRGRR